MRPLIRNCHSIHILYLFDLLMFYPHNARSFVPYKLLFMLRVSTKVQSKFPAHRYLPLLLHLKAH
jgi:hypothetical protein